MLHNIQISLVHNGDTVIIIPDLRPREADLGCEPVLLLVDVEPQSVDAEPELNESERKIECRSSRNLTMT